MSTVTCPNGHQSASTDYCDTCGAPMAGAANGAEPAAAPAPPAAPLTCPNCDAPRTPDDAFCEVCGLDFATGQLPAPAAPAVPPAPGEWVAVVEADRAFYEGNESPGVTVSFPGDLAPREVPLRADEVLVGRRSDSRGIFPDVDLGPPHEDPGVSRRHAVLRRQGDGWVVADQGSTNGTWVRGEVLGPGEEVPLAEGEHLLVGAWTRITVRKAGSAAAP
jgi:hypothetical protein